MVFTEKERFAAFLSESFENDVFFRQLRLSDMELQYVKKKYPNASVKRCHTNEELNEKHWYEVNLLPQGKEQGEYLYSNETATIQAVLAER
jgi:hypothetical protein